MTDPGKERRGERLAPLARLFLKLGFFAFGGPAAHVAMLEDEVVERRGWLDRARFLDLVGATNLIPGPNSTEMMLHVGLLRGGWRGLLLAGLCFIGPAAAITGALAWFYAAYGSLPAVKPFLVGIKPAVLAVILGALLKLGRKALKSWTLALVAAAVVGLVLAGVGEIVAFLAGAVAGTLWLWVRHRTTSAAGLVLPALLASGTGGAAAGSAATSVSLGKLFLFFMKIGAILYGSGYVLVAFLEGDLVRRLGWLTEAQLLDAIAIGQLTPGPVLTTATFVGYLLAGPAGAVVGTVGIFLPCFLFVPLLRPLVPRLRRSSATAAFLDAVNAAAVALMLTATLFLAGSTLVSPLAWGIALVAAIAHLRWKVGSAWLVLAGAALGWAGSWADLGA